ncbi:glycosyltransferase [Acuticoccus kandeliae]|uniref:glycosyltransferase n=1 Tax=Acuticoccus kandeliae TaxID=2073160 RepID=UPI000D3E4121|nr:glycosyltransferase [Acuticoccus kandeliae]
MTIGCAPAETRPSATAETGAKIVAFCWIFPLVATRGGVERVTLRVMDGLARRGHQCLFIRYDLATDSFLVDEEDIGDLDAFLCRHEVDTLIDQNGAADRVAQELEGSSWRGRLLVCHHVEPLYLRKIYDLRRVIAEAGNRENRLRVRLAWLARLAGYPLWQRGARRRIAATQTRNYRRADRYVMLSRRFLPDLTSLLERNPLTKVAAVPNPLSFEIEPGEARGYEKRNEVLIVSRLSEGQKRISAALEAWRRIEAEDQGEWQLKIVGDGPDAADLQRLARKLGLKRVRFLGFQNPLPHYRSAAILLMTSRVEGWGLTLTEAMQTGTVPVAFDAYASLRDIVEDGETGIVVANGDVAALAEATLRLTRDPAQRNALAARAIEAAQRYRLDRVLDQWEAIL